MLNCQEYKIRDLYLVGHSLGGMVGYIVTSIIEGDSS